MSPGDRASRIYSLLAAALVAAFLGQSIGAGSRKSAVFDEPPHIAAGLSYVQKHVFNANPQHPPLLKELAALSLSLAGVRWPNLPMARNLVNGAGKNLEWPVGNDILRSNGPDRVLFWGRLPLALLGGLLGALIFLWGRELVGPRAALFALFLYAFDPTPIAHACLVTTDVGMAAFTLLFLFALWRYLQAPGRMRLVWCGLALGAVLGAKFSAVALVPVGALLLLAGKWFSRRPAPPAPEAAPNSPCPCGSGKKFKQCHGARKRAKTAVPPDSTIGRIALNAGTVFAAMLAIAALAIQALYLFSRDPWLYLKGLKLVNADHTAGYTYYLHGALGERSPIYFAVAYLLKEPLAAVLLAGIGCVAIVLRKGMPPIAKLFLLLPPVVLFSAYTMGADQLGERYIIPVLPFAYLAGGVALAALVDRGSAWARVAAVGLLLWVVVEAVAIYPDHLSYFNEMACVLENPGQVGLDGGTRCGPLWLDDSNVDWGQGLKQLRAWLEANHETRTVQLYYFGTLPPEAYGLKYVNRAVEGFVTDPEPGLYAVSAHLLARARAAGVEWAQRLRPKAIVGHAFYIYEISGKS